MPPTDRSDHAFAARAGMLLLGLIGLGFGGRALARGDLDAIPVGTLAPHVASVAAWYGLFVLQARWSSTRRRWHRLAGRLSVPLVIAMLASGVSVMAANYRLTGDAPLAFFNLLNLCQFLGLYAAALIGVRDRRRHARLMLFASFAIMPPALVRIVQAVGLPEPLSVLLIGGLWIPCIRHDRAALGQVHSATWWGVGVIAAGLVIGGPVGFSTSWAALLDGMLGAT